MDVPDDIVVDILRRLPVKSLVRFRCVSKSWRSLISDPTFVRTHLSRLIQSHISMGTASSILLSGSTTGILSFLQHHDDGSAAVTAELELGLVKNSKYRVKGHCDGLLCLVIDNEQENGLLVVYNPSIREHRKLPLPPNFHSTTESFGIGYDPTIGDYKIVTVPSWYCRLKYPGYNHRVEIFTLKSKSNSWRTLADYETPPYFVDNGFQTQATINANGGLYWLCLDNKASRYVILRFDLVEEKFRVVPTAPDKSCWSITWLGSLRDSLCVIHSQLATHIHVWSTKDDETWTKLIIIPTLQGVSPSVYSCLYKPFCYTKTGALLMNVRGKGFVVYDPGENRFRQLAVREAEHHLQEIVYCESLVSPNCGNDDES
ncbi:F-box/kelch-repeat protein At3g23880 [Ziziphus jujuba]|uniref:F-box/kelch-repeat protein At3g23880 n=1 Tax=Ziziphus jujuba TaxID=326968 RepID=A0A6P3Z7H6_ZIZJJ|nr:F-box/kelch-repeat protein At3g23880 [Ziziphus jujuba]